MLTIAEIGSNYRDLDDILSYCHRLNADVIKLQCYNSFDLYGSGGRCGDYRWTYAQLHEIRQLCNQLGKKLMVSIFNHWDVEAFHDVVDLWKVASSEITYLPLLEEMAKTSKDIFVSCGGATFFEIDNVVELIPDHQLVLMACNVEYPTERSYPWYGKMLGDKYNVRWGYSDHSREVFITHRVTKELGAYAWEKHVRFTSIVGTPDEKVAITVKDFYDAVMNQPITRFNPHRRVKKPNGWVRPL